MPKVLLAVFRVVLLCKYTEKRENRHQKNDEKRENRYQKNNKNEKIGTKKTVKNEKIGIKNLQTYNFAILPTDA